MNGSNIITSILRTAAQAVMGSLVAWLIARGVEVPAGTGDQVVLVIVSGGVVTYTALVRWLETRPSPAARFLGRLLMLGLSQQPVYYRPEELPVNRRGVSG